MKYQTKDSGKRQEYESGMRRDSLDNKPDFSLLLATDLPYKDQMLTRFAELMARGATKYGRRNWELSNSDEELGRFKSSANRHFMQWMCGEDDEDHAAAVWFNILAAERLKTKQEDQIHKDKLKAFVDAIEINQGEYDKERQTQRTR